MATWCLGVVIAWLIYLFAIFKLVSTAIEDATTVAEIDAAGHTFNVRLVVGALAALAAIWLPVVL